MKVTPLTRPFCCAVTIAIYWGWWQLAPGYAEDSAEQVAFFEAKIRPVLAEHCYKCHGPDKQEAGLRLDSRDGWSRGGQSGPAIVPGQPEQSLLWRAIRYDDTELQMPPDGKLPDRILADIAEWIRRGAVDPRKEPSGKTPEVSSRPGSGSRHWAYQPCRRPQVPYDPQDTWSFNAVDRFIWDRLRREGRSPAGDAADEVLLRRVYFDLTGLPPSLAERELYLGDRREDRWERLVDQLLASPRFGERWGRHWLDVVRYGESLTLRGFILSEAWRYRDYVIDSYNRDMPWADFLVEQIAGDLLGGSDWQEKQRRRIATTFWMLGNINLEEQDKRLLDMDLIDEQLDVVGRGILAQTITCARCHDHKFDPIPTEDYYSLAAILRNVEMLEHANVSKWLEIPLPLPEEQERYFAERERAVAQLEEKIQHLRQQLAAMEKPTSATPPTIVPVDALPGIVVDDTMAKRVGHWQTSQYAKRYIGDGYVHDQNADKGMKTITFHPRLPQAGRYQVRLAYTPGGNRASNVPVTIFSADGEVVVHVDQRREPPVEGHFVLLGTFRFEANDQGFVLVSNEGTDGHVIADAVQFLPADQPATSDKTGSPPQPNSQEIQLVRQELSQLETQLKSAKEEAAKRPRVISIRETGRLQPMRVHIRGNPQNLGREVSRGFLSVANFDPPPQWPCDQSGRRQLAEWLASPRNPLTARVYVNRVWHWLFGAGLVRTPDNFGTTGEEPTHPELLDYLACEFIEHGWSTKWLLRQLVLSHTYRLASVTDEGTLRADPENRLWSRAFRKPLEAECLRDAILFASGSLSLEMGGSTIRPQLTSDYGYEDRSLRRSVYVPVFRNALPEIFAVFDFADPSVVTGARNTSTVAPQALYVMNHWFPRLHAERTARRLLAESTSDDDLIKRAFLVLLGRLPTGDELAACQRFLQEDRLDGKAAPAEQRLNENVAPAEQQVERVTRLVHALFGCIDFRYIQ